MSAVFSSELALRDHARLAQRLADEIVRLREARFQHWDTRPARAVLNEFLVDELIPYLQAEEGMFYHASAHSESSGTSRPVKKRRLSRRLREHRELIGAADALRSATTQLQTLTEARRVASLLNAHLVVEDRDLLAALNRQTDGGLAPTLTDALATELDTVLIYDHDRVARAVSLARHVAAEDPANRLIACDRAVAALSQHAAVMSTVAYPIARRLLRRGERVRLHRMTADLRQAERAMRHLNRLVRGAARENPGYEISCGRASKRLGDATSPTKNRCFGSWPRRYLQNARSR